jgi:hypothetical protein
VIIPERIYMAFNHVEDRQKIIKIIDHLISTKDEIKILVKGESNPFVSRIIKAEHNRPSMVKGANSIFIIDKLQPEKGNNLIQSTEKVILKFVISEQPCTCNANYIGISSMPPYFGFILSTPEIIEIVEKRKEPRVVYEIPDFLLAEIIIGKGTKEEKTYELDVIDCAAHGLGLMIPEKHADLINKVRKGDMLKDIHFYASNAMLKIDGIVRHITKIEDGKFKGGYYIGIESKDIIPTCKSSK